MKECCDRYSCSTYSLKLGLQHVNVSVAMAGRRNRRTYHRNTTNHHNINSTSEVVVSIPVAIHEIANLSATTLFDCALFKIASELWRATFDDDEVYHDTSMKDRIKSVTEQFLQHHSEVPAPVRKQIISAISKIGREINDFFYRYKRRSFYGLDCPEYHESNVPFASICWTSYFTVDRVKTSMSYHKNLKSVEGYECPEWLQVKWRMESEHTKSLLVRHFGKYSTLVYIYWATSIGYLTGSMSDHLLLSGKYFDHGTVEEKVFKFFIVNGNIECLDYFLNRLTPEKYQIIATEMIEDIISDYVSSVIRGSEHIKARMIAFLWKYVDKKDLIRIVQLHFSDFYRYLLCSAETESLIFAVEWYEPLIHGTSRESFKFLESAAEKIQTDSNEGQRYKSLFWKLFERVRISLATIDIVNLLEILLHVQDTKTATKMVELMDDVQRTELLNQIHLIWNDFWTANIGRETFFTFFFDVKTQSVRNGMRSN